MPACRNGCYTLADRNVVLYPHGDTDLDASGAFAGQYTGTHSDRCGYGGKHSYGDEYGYAGGSKPDRDLDPCLR